MVDKNYKYKSGQEKGYTQTEIQLQRHSIEKYFWNRLQTTEAILPPPVNPPISVQLGAVRVDPATQYFSNPTHLYLDAFLLLTFFLIRTISDHCIVNNTKKWGKGYINSKFVTTVPDLGSGVRYPI